MLYAKSIKPYLTLNEFHIMIKEDSFIDKIVATREKLQKEVKLKPIEAVVTSWKIGNVKSETIMPLMSFIKDATEATTTPQKILVVVQNAYKNLSILMTKTSLTLSGILSVVVDNVKKIIPNSVIKFAKEIYEKYLKVHLNRFRNVLRNTNVKVGSVAINAWILLKNLIFCGCIGIVLYNIYKIVFKKDVTGQELTQSAIEDVRLTHGLILNTIGVNLTYLLKYCKATAKGGVSISEALPDSQVPIRRYDKDISDVSPVAKYFKTTASKVAQETSNFIGKFIALIIVLPIVCALLLLMYKGVSYLKDKYGESNTIISIIHQSFKSIFNILRIEVIN